MIKTKFVFAVSLVAMLAVSSAWASVPVDDDSVGAAHTVYTDQSPTDTKVEGGTAIAGVTYVNRAVNKAGASAQAAEAHAAAAGQSALDAADSAAAAASSAQSANDALANKQPKSTADYQMGNKSGGWTTMTTEQQKALDSGVTSTTKVTRPASTAVGSATVPVYVDADGTVKQITSYDGNAASATKATQDGNGKVIASTYATKALVDSLGDTQSGLVSDVNELKTGKQDVLTAGANITIAEDGTISAKDTVYTLPAATSSVLGGVKVDTALSSTSTNPVQNKVINTALANKQDKSTAVTHTANTAVGSATVPVYVDADGTVKQITSYSGKAASAGTADSATKATQDGSGNNIVNTYATKTALSDGLATKQGTLTAGANITISNGTISAKDTVYTLPTASATTLGGVKVDTALSSTSTNPVQNKVINTALANKQDKSTAVKVTTSGTAVGSATVPVYVNSNGVATAITSYEGTAAKATADASGNNIVNTYATKAQLNSLGDTQSGLVTDVNELKTGTQAKSTAAYQMGNASGGWTTMTTEQQNALNSGVTSTTKVTHTASTEVGTTSRPVYVTSAGVATAVTGMSIPYGKEFEPTSWATIWVE